MSKKNGDEQPSTKLVYDGEDYFALSLPTSDLSKLAKVLPYALCVGELFAHYEKGRITEVKTILENPKIFSAYPNIINGVNENNTTLLGLAAKDGNCEFIEYLLKRPNIDVNKGKLNPLYPNYQLTPIDIAIQYGQIETGVLLVENGAILKKGANGEPIIRISSQPMQGLMDNFDKYITKVARQTETYREIRKLSGLTSKTESHKEDEIQSTVLSQPLKDFSYYNDTYNEIINAICNKSLSESEIIGLIKKNEGVEKVVNHLGQNLHHYAARQNMHDVEKLLVKLIPKFINSRDNKGFYPLDYALKEGNALLAATLVENNAEYSKYASLYMASTYLPSPNKYTSYMETLKLAEQSDKDHALSEAAHALLNNDQESALAGADNYPNSM